MLRKNKYLKLMAYHELFDTFLHFVHRYLLSLKENDKVVSNSHASSSSPSILAFLPSLLTSLLELSGFVKLVPILGQMTVGGSHRLNTV